MQKVFCGVGMKRSQKGNLTRKVVFDVKSAGEEVSYVGQGLMMEHLDKVFDIMILIETPFVKYRIVKLVS